jgi:adenylate cyclase
VGDTARPDLDLTPDLTVSRPHARLKKENGVWLLEDLNSTHGTLLNGQEIQGKGACRVAPGDVFQIGESTLRLAADEVAPVAAPARPAESTNGSSANGTPAAVSPVAVSPELAMVEKATPMPDLFAGARDASFSVAAAPVLVPPAAGDEREGRITVSIDAAQLRQAQLERDRAAQQKPKTEQPNTQQREAARQEAAHDAAQLRLLHEVLAQCGGDVRLDDALQSLIERLVAEIPAAARGALLLRGREGDTLLLRAFHSAHGPVVSETLARRAMSDGIGFIYTRGDETPGASIAHYRIETGMYAPLMWHGKALGVLCVDNPESTVEFRETDLRLLVTAAQMLALALANENLQEALRRESAIKANLLRQFSPQIAEQLLTHGTLQLSGERSEVTILCSDIRGFTQLTQNMEPIEVVEMLNDYFSRLIPIIFQHGGTVDKYIGDAILAVFGSPKKDPQQHENAVRAALGMQEEMIKSNAARAAKGRAICEIGIGVHSGEVLHGFIGASDRMELTIIGDAVNRATRFCDGARGGEVIVSPQLYQWVWKIAQIEPLTVTTKHGDTITAFRLLNLTPPSPVT